MRILYGVSGAGLGHSSRAKEIISFLEKNGHKVLVFTYGEAYPVLKNYFHTYKIQGIPLHYSKGNLVFTKTAYHGIKSILGNLLNSNKIRRKILEFKPEVCITDMEPLVSVVAYLFNLPLISVNNQHTLVAFDFDIPKESRGGAFIAKIATILSAPRAKRYLALSFIKKESAKKNIQIVGPVIRKEVLKLKPRKTNIVVVYQPFLTPSLIETLSGINENFVVYTYNKTKSEHRNIAIKRISKPFINELAMAKAVIGTAGFSLISEALHLKKPYFAMPYRNQFEQTVNAFFLKNEKIGDFSTNPTKEQIEKFLANLPVYEKNLKKHRINPEEALLVLNDILKSISRNRKKQ
jgi:uncharacterized protein (TIGR00661 family)